MLEAERAKLRTLEQLVHMEREKFYEAFAELKLAADHAHQAKTHMVANDSRLAGYTQSHIYPSPSVDTGAGFW